MLKYDSDITLKTIRKCIQRQFDTRNHRFALQQSHIQHDMRKFSFPNRIIPLWNSLPDYVVLSPTLNTFKARLDRFWENQDVRYNWKADILYTGSRSNVELMFWLLYSDCTIFGVIYNGGPRPASSDLHYYYSLLLLLKVDRVDTIIKRRTVPMFILISDLTYFLLHCCGENFLGITEVFGGNLAFLIDMSSALSTVRVDLLLQAAELIDRHDSTGI